MNTAIPEGMDLEVFWTHRSVFNYTPVPAPYQPTCRKQGERMMALLLMLKPGSRVVMETDLHDH